MALVENSTGKLPLDCRNLPLYNSKLLLCDQRIIYSFYYGRFKYNVITT